jgi:hypothetical protein
MSFITIIDVPCIDQVDLQSFIKEASCRTHAAGPSFFECNLTETIPK